MCVYISVCDVSVFFFNLNFGYDSKTRKMRMKTSQLLCITMCPPPPPPPPPTPPRSFQDQDVSNAFPCICNLVTSLWSFFGRIKNGRILPHEIYLLIQNLIWNEIPWRFMNDVLKTKQHTRIVLGNCLRISSFRWLYLSNTHHALQIHGYTSVEFPYKRCLHCVQRIT